MSRFYGTLKGDRPTESTRGSHRELVSHTAGWKGAIRVTVYADGDVDRYKVDLVPWQNSGGVIHALAEGELRA